MGVKQSKYNFYEEKSLKESSVLIQPKKKNMQILVKSLEKSDNKQIQGKGNELLNDKIYKY